MGLFGKEKTDFSRNDRVRSSKDIIDDFFYTFHPAEAEECFREVSTILNNRNISITEQEKEDVAYFFERLNELIKASYLSRS